MRFSLVGVQDLIYGNYNLFNGLVFWWQRDLHYSLYSSNPQTDWGRRYGGGTQKGSLDDSCHRGISGRTPHHSDSMYTLTNNIDFIFIHQYSFIPGIIILLTDHFRGALLVVRKEGGQGGHRNGRGRGWVLETKSKLPIHLVSAYRQTAGRLSNPTPPQSTSPRNYLLPRFSFSLSRRAMERGHFG